MAELAYFKSGDGVEHMVEVGTAAFAHMAKPGNGFTRFTESGERYVDPVETEIEADENAEIDLSKLNRTELIEKAAELGIEIDADDKAQTKKVIIAAIDAKLAESEETADES